MVAFKIKIFAYFKLVSFLFQIGDFAVVLLIRIGDFIARLLSRRKIINVKNSKFYLLFLYKCFLNTYNKSLINCDGLPVK